MINSTKNTAKNNSSDFVMADSSYVKQKASKWALFVFITLFFSTQNVYAENCSAKSFDQTVKVAHVFDGDTIQLESGYKLRLIGINTPERGRDGNQDQPFYTEAKTQLLQIIKNNQYQINIIFGQDKHDRYKRLLAHIFTHDGKNISELLLKKGLGYNIAIAPNIKFLKCYSDAENHAKKFKRGIWNHPFSTPVNASSISKSKLGFQRVTGTVQRLGESRSSFWLNLDEKFSLKIQKKYLPQFTDYHPKSLVNKKLIAQGWIYLKNNEYRMSIKHPASIQIQSTD
ncbi:MAG: thermonuclease family protein [Gammaproteobacteria bacterium]|nr:thermonuclease family protein [Gammaproteobacteria bacterium]